jgi:hypothetical protein
MTEDNKKETTLLGNLTFDGNEAEAALSSNTDALSFGKFIFTDDKPNGNKQRVPLEEFDNIIKTASFMPIKMAEGKISQGHPGTRPIGVITQVKKENDTVVGLAGLWKKEYAEDIKILKEMVQKGTLPQISWELLYSDSTKDEEGVETLSGVVVKAATIVGMPAYQGRTPMTALASQDVYEEDKEMAEAAVWTTAYVNDLPDSSFLYISSGGKKDSTGKTEPRTLRHLPYKDADGKVDLAHLRNALARLAVTDIPAAVKDGIRKRAERLLQKVNSTASLDISLEDIEREMEDELNQKIAALEAKVAELEAKSAEVETKNAELTTQVTALSEYKTATETKLAELTQQNTELSEYKNVIEKEKADNTKFAGIKDKFKSVGIEKDETYFNEKKDTLMKLDESELDFMLQEMVAFSASQKVTNSSLKIPNLRNDKDNVTVKDIVSALKEHRK